MIKTTPKIAIVTTTYNHQDYIAETIESIIGQTHTNRELFIGDDSPGNETREIIQQYVKKYPNKIHARHHAPNKGIVDNTNFLLDQIGKEFEYVAFLEGDDLYVSENLEKKLKIFENHKEIGLVYNDIALIDANSQVYQKKFLSSYLQNQTLSLSKFVEKDLVYASYSTLMIKKNILNENPPRDLGIEKNIISDWDLMGRIISKYPVRGIAEQLTHYRRHQSGITISFEGKQRLIDQLEQCVLHYQKKGLIGMSTHNHFMAKKYIREACNDILRGKYQLGWSHWKKSWKYGWHVKPFLKIVGFGALILPKTWTEFLIEKTFIIFPGMRRRLLGE